MQRTFIYKVGKKEGNAGHKRVEECVKSGANLSSVATRDYGISDEGEREVDDSYEEERV